MLALFNACGTLEGIPPAPRMNTLAAVRRYQERLATCIFLHVYGCTILCPILLLL